MESTHDAASTLAEIRTRQAAVVDRINVPRWYWWFVGLGVIPVGFAADTRNPRLIVPLALLYGLGVLGTNLWYVLGAAAGARISQQVLGPAAALAIVAFVFLVVGLSLGTAFGLRAAGFGHPGAAGTLVGGVLVIGGGPRLGAWLRAEMMRNRA